MDDDDKEEEGLDLSTRLIKPLVEALRMKGV